MSLQPKVVRGLRVPLFDRLVDAAPELQKEHTPLRVYGRAALEASIARDLGRLLNTRRTVHGPSDLQRAGAGLTVLDYGIPDFAHRSSADEPDNRTFAEIIRIAIERWEPRLENPSVTLTRDPANARQLLASISGRLRLGVHTEPVTFSVLRLNSEGELEVLAPASDASSHG